MDRPDIVRQLRHKAPTAPAGGSMGQGQVLCVPAIQTVLIPLVAVAFLVARGILAGVGLVLRHRRLHAGVGRRHTPAALVGTPDTTQEALPLPSLSPTQQNFYRPNKMSKTLRSLIYVLAVLVAGTMVWSMYSTSTVVLVLVFSSTYQYYTMNAIDQFSE